MSIGDNHYQPHFSSIKQPYCRSIFKQLIPDWGTGCKRRKFWRSSLREYKVRLAIHGKMEMTLIFLAISLIIGSIAAIFAFQPQWLPEIHQARDWKSSDHDHMVAETPMRSFSLSNTLLIIGPEKDHTACQIQRRLLKPAVPLLIREDVSIMEIYGLAAPRKNGEPLAWLDPALLRHALDAEDGFSIVYVGDDGKAVFQRRSPMLTEMIIDKARLNVALPIKPKAKKRSSILAHLQAA